MIMPKVMKRVPAILDMVVLLILVEISLPMYMVRMDSRVSAVMTPVRTRIELYWVAKSPEVICVLSPHSDMKIRVKPERNEFLVWSLLSVFVSFVLSVSSPKVMKMMPEAIFSRVTGMMFVIHDPIRTATPSTIRKASIAPSSRWMCFLVFEDRSRMDSCVLSPSSARAVEASGISMSGIIFRLLWASKQRLRFRVVLGRMLRVRFRVESRLLCPL